MANLVWDNSFNAMARGFGVREFGAALEKAMERKSEERQKTSFAPSGLGYSGSCPRYWYYAFHGANFEYNTDAPAMANMDAGTAAGARLADVLKKADLLIDAEIPVRHDNPPIFGYIDAMIRWKGEPVVVEVKTTRNETWQHRVTSNSVPGYQMLQLLIYMYVTGKDKGFFLTENKNTHEIFILPVKMTDEYRQLVEATFDWMRMVKQNSEEDKLPTRPFTKSSMQCKGCPVRNTCWEGYKRGSVNGEDPAPGVITLPILEVPK